MSVARLEVAKGREDDSRGKRDAEPAGRELELGALNDDRTGGRRDRHVADFDRDGWLDIYVCAYDFWTSGATYDAPTPYYDATNGPPNFLYRNRGKGVFEDVTEQREVEDSLRTANAELEQRIRARGMELERAGRINQLGEMAAGLAHEIRNPLNAAHLQLTVVQRRLSRSAGADVPGALAAAELVSSEMQRLATLVEAFLQFARPQPLHFSRVDLRATSAGVIEQMAREAGEAGVELRLEDGPPVFADADDERLKQVLRNLVCNAVEATGEGGHVRVLVEQNGLDARIAVEDDGPGLPSLDAPIFEPFYTTKSDGTGLGLAIVHRIVTDHGGHVGVESRAGCTVFSVHVPAVQ